MSDLIWTLIGFLLTLLIFSYIFGDNLLFRITSYLFVGVAAGYAAILVIYQIVLGRLVYPLLEGSLIALVPLLLSLLLLFKLFPRLSAVGNLPMAYLVGAGAAVAIGGAITGTIFGQMKGAFGMFKLAESAAPLSQLLEGAVFLIGTIAVLLYFQFSARSKSEGQPPRRPAWIEGIGKFGQIFIAITFGALFAGVLSASFTALIERVDFLRATIMGFF